MGLQFAKKTVDLVPFEDQPTQDFPIAMRVPRRQPQLPIPPLQDSR